MDGFVPGEGAAFYLLSGSDAPEVSRTVVRVVVNGAASSRDQGHRYGDAPARGEGLSDALERTRRQLRPPVAPIETIFAGFNGESFDAKLWGVTRLRHNDFFSSRMVIEHPADKYGDTGAASGAILVALATQSLVSGTRLGPALVWAASDREPRACAVVSVQPN
jgi:3-oxoacyl-[acyl-carrier-protein] synthase-1